MTPLVRVSNTISPGNRIRVIAAMHKAHPEIPIADIEKEFDEGLKAEAYKNDKYHVIVRRGPDIIHLSVKRLDRKAVHDWRDMQTIKNELVGPENEAVEIYPAESRRVDTTNQFHLWVFTDPTFRLPFGFFPGKRLVSEVEAGGLKQRPLEKEQP